MLADLRSALRSQVLRMFIKTYIVLLLFCCYSAPAMAQGRSARPVLLKAADADLETLLEAISQSGAALNHLSLRGGQAAGAETHAKFMQILSDERVRRIYAYLQEMPKRQAAILVRESFDKDLELLIARQANIGGTVYGLHAKLWLSHQFEAKEDYRKQLNKWEDWVHQKLRDESFLEWYPNKDAPYSRKRDSFTRYHSPEILMRVNLELIDQLQDGDLDENSEFAQLLAGAGMEGYPKSSRSNYSVLPFDAERGEDVEPIARVPAVFPRWYGLDRLPEPDRVVLAARIRNLVDPTGFDVEMIEELEANGVQLKFMSSQSEQQESYLAQNWSVDFPPTKQFFIETLDRLHRRTPESERQEWQELIDEVHEWLSELPEEGLTEERRKVMHWPAKAEEEDKGSTLRIRIILKNTKAFSGKLKKPNEDSDQPKEKPEGDCEESDR